MQRALCRIMVFAGLASLLATGCTQEIAGPGCEGESCNEKPEEQEPPRLYVDPPFGVGFDCVSVGCEGTRTFHVENRGEGEAVITLIRLSVDTSNEFSLSLSSETSATPPAFPTVEAPIALAAGKAVDVVVAYRPADADQDAGALWIEWYDGATAYEDAIVERVELPIQTRVLGDPEAELVASELNFGFVAPGESRTLFIEVRNQTQGSAILALEPPQLTPGSAYEFSLANPSVTVFVNPGEVSQIPVTFTPTAVDWYEGQVVIPTNDGAHPQVVVNLRGTAIRDPYLSVEEPTDWLVDFGEVRVGGDRTRPVIMRNLGGQPLQLTASLPAPTSDWFASPIPLDTPLPSIPPLGYIRFDVTATPDIGGERLGEMHFSTNDPSLPNDWLDLRVYGVYPDVSVSQGTLQFGDIVQNWTAPAQSVFVGNGGNGELTITGVEWEVGSSSQVRLASMPLLPIKLTSTDDPLELSVYVQAQTLGPANAVLLVHTDAVDEPTRRIEVFANVVSCETGCPVNNGTPSCTSGSCQVDTCFVGYHDADRSFATGCECGEDTGPNGSVEVGDFCSSGANVGPLADACGSGNRQWVNRYGTLHDAADEDLYFFHADDGGSITCDTFGDSFKARVQLVNPPPGVELCVRATNGGGGCGGENQRNCGLTSWSSDSGWGSDGDVDVTVWVRRTPGSAPMCGDYRVRFCANDNEC